MSSPILTASRIDSSTQRRRRVHPPRRCFTCGRPKSCFNSDQDCYACQEKRRVNLEGIRYRAGAPFGQTREPYDLETAS